MSKKKLKPILSDKIAELMAPRRLLDPEIDSEDETAARAVDYDIDEELDEVQPVSKLSDIRRKNVKLLHDVDVKYRGKISSRKEMEMDSESEADDDSVDDEGSDENDEIQTNERSIGEFSMGLTPKQRIKLAQEAVESDNDDDDIDSAESGSDEDDLKAFTKQLHAKKSPKIEAEDDSDDNDDDLATEEVEKWDDDYEGEEIDEEESEIDEEADEDEDGSGEEGTDEDESDFDGGDIIPKNDTVQPETKSAKLDMSRILPKQRADDSMSKGFCVQNQLQIWEKLLEVRIHSQKMLIKANTMPQPEKFEQLSSNAEFSELANDTVDQVSRLVSQMRDLQSLLLNQFSETKEIGAKRKRVNVDGISDAGEKRSRLASELEADYSNFKEYQYSVISKWHDRTKVLTPGSIKTQKQQGNIDVLRKIESVLANRQDLIKKSQLLKGGYELFDKSTGIVEKKQLLENEGRDENNDEQSTYSSEVYDDTDFYHTQLRELIEYKTSSSSNANEMAKQFAELQKLRKKMKKTVDTRASKGRKIRYVVHNKLVSFMAPNNTSNWNEDQKTELFKSLFGAQL